MRARSDLNPHCRDDLSDTTSMGATHNRMQTWVRMPIVRAKPNPKPVCGIDSRSAPRAGARQRRATAAATRHASAPHAQRFRPLRLRHLAAIHIVASSSLDARVVSFQC